MGDREGDWSDLLGVELPVTLPEERPVHWSAVRYSEVFRWIRGRNKVNFEVRRKK